MSLQTGRTKATRVTALLGLMVALAIVGLQGNQQVSAGVPAKLSQVPNSANKIEQRVLADTRNGQSTQFIVLFGQPAELSRAYSMKDQDARGWFVYNTLRAYTEKTQAGARSMLAQMGKAYQSYWVANALVVSGDRNLVDRLAARPEVTRIESDHPARGIDDPVTPSDVMYADSPSTVEWGVTNVNAPQVWAMGYTGQGIVIGNQDTGMLWTHTAVKPHYRGWNGTTADHNYNWYDGVRTPVPGHTTNPCGYAINVPCDDQGHGTHTTGTTSGDDGTGNQIGVAPGAKWIGCRNMDAGDGRPSTYMNCFQFFVAPHDLNGQNPNPTLRPHVMNNSWGCPTSEECAPDTLQASVEACQAAGIMVVVSAGNSGSACSTVTAPPAIYEASFSVGAITSANVLAGFSSRGQVTVDGSNRLKPNISAPGVNVRSSTNGSDTSYAAFQGTSMAGPHVVGVVALLWSARPELSRMITETKNLLQNTANPNVTLTTPQTCNGIPNTTIPNNSFGWGRVDVLAAVNAAALTPSPTPTSVATATATACAMPFTDVAPTDYFYAGVRYLYCRGAISGYGTVFLPYNNTTRGQLTKIVVLGYGSPIYTPPTPTFRDVDTTNAFYQYVETAYHLGFISGYACGTGCLEFRPGNNVTRAQLSKIVVNAAGWTPINPAVATFRDVPTTDTFYQYVETAYCHQIISGYSCGTGCLEFRPGASATRGQIAKIVYEAILNHTCAP